MSQRGPQGGLAGSPSVKARRNPAVFILAGLVLLLLWIPAGPVLWKLEASQLPPWILEGLSLFKSIKPEAVWEFRVTYFLYVLATVYGIYFVFKKPDSLHAAGLGFQNFGQACRLLAVPTLVGAVLLIGLGAVSGSIDFTPRFIQRLIPIPAFFQQMGIHYFLHIPLYAWFGKTRATVWVVTSFFVLFHLPNPGLSLGTLYGMYFWARAYQHAPNLYALALSHALLSAVLMHTMPKFLLPSVSVGWRFVEKGIQNQWWGVW
jgi:hypothetical protein